jgi:hypothetical protein
MRRGLLIAAPLCAVTACASDDPPRPRVVDRLSGAVVANAHIARAAGGWIEASAPGYLKMRVPANLSTEVRLFPAVTSANDDERLSERLAYARARRTGVVADGDVRPAARRILDAQEAHPETLQVVTRATLAPAPSGAAAAKVAPPATIRVWRRGLDGSTASCGGRVDVLPFDAYVKGVLPHEWIPSWQPRALEMGAVAIRTYAAAWVAAGGKYECADLDDTAASQVYRDETVARTDAAVDATAGVFVVQDDALVFAEYSAENSDPTATGVAEPYCTGRVLSGHGRGACQWGTQRWATSENRDYVWMAAHYYPGTSLLYPYAASPGEASYAATMTSGELAPAWLEVANDGSAAWPAGATTVATASPREHASPFHDAATWLSPSHPVSSNAASAPGAVTRYAFVMKAPEVAAPTTFVEHFGLVREGNTWFGPEDNLVTWTITVNPRSTPAPTADAGRGGAEEDDDDKEVTSGCSIGPVGPIRPGRPGGYSLTKTAAMLLLAVAAWRRGRQLVIVGVE